MFSSGVCLSVGTFYNMELKIYFSFDLILIHIKIQTWLILQTQTWSGRQTESELHLRNAQYLLSAFTVCR